MKSFKHILQFRQIYVAISRKANEQLDQNVRFRLEENHTYEIEKENAMRPKTEKIMYISLVLFVEILLNTLQ